MILVLLSFNLQVQQHVINIIENETVVSVMYSAPKQERLTFNFGNLAVVLDTHIKCVDKVYED